MRKRLTALFSILGLAGPLSTALPAGAQDKPKGAPAPGPAAPNTPQTRTQRDADLKKQQEELARKEAARQLELKLQKEAMHIKMQKADAEQQSEKDKVNDKWKKNESELKGEKTRQAIKLDKNEAANKAAKGQAPVATPPQSNKQP